MCSRCGSFSHFLRLTVGFQFAANVQRFQEEDNFKTTNLISHLRVRHGDDNVWREYQALAASVSEEEKKGQSRVQCQCSITARGCARPQLQRGAAGRSRVPTGPDKCSIIIVFLSAFLWRAFSHRLLSAACSQYAAAKYSANHTSTIYVSLAAWSSQRHLLPRLHRGNRPCHRGLPHTARDSTGAFQHHY